MAELRAGDIFLNDYDIDDYRQREGWIKVYEGG